MMRRVLHAALLGSVTLLSCTDEPTTGLAQGGIEFEIHTVGIMPTSSAAAAGEPAAVGGPLDVGPARTHGGAIDSARVVLTSPALSATRYVTATPGSTVTVSSLPVGTYAAELQGWHDDEMVYRGNVTGIVVRSDEQSAVAQILFAPTSLQFESIGETMQLTSPAGTMWSSASSGVVQVSPTGLLTALTNGSASVSGTLGASSVGVTARVEQRVVSVTVSPASASIAAGATQQFTAQGFDAGGTEVTGVNALWVSGNHFVATISPSGLATGTGGGTVAISASVRGEPGSANLTVTGTAPAVGLRFATEPGAVSEKTAFSPSVEFVTATGARATTTTGPVTIAIGTNPASGTLSGTLTVNAVAGLATFNNVSIDAVGSGYTLSATAASLPAASSAPFDVIALTPSRLRFTTEPAAAIGEMTVFNVTVQVENSVGTRVPTASDVVTLAIGTNPGSGNLIGTLTRNASNGTASFALTIDQVGAGYTLTAASGSLTGATTAPFDVVSGAPTHLAFVTQPPSTTFKAETFGVSVEIRNALGNRVTTASNQITVVLDANSGGGVLSGVKTVTASSGLASFSFAIDQPGVGYTLAATAVSLTGATSDAFDVIEPPTEVRWLVEPTQVRAGQPMFMQVEVVDAGGNRVTAGTRQVSISIGANPGGGGLSGLVGTGTVNGVATFPATSISNEGAGYTIVASSPGATSDTSAPFTVGGVVLITSTTYVNFVPAAYDAEASNLLAGFQSFGSPVNQVTDISALSLSNALGTARVFDVPEQEGSGSLAVDLTVAARTVIEDWVEAGGTMIIHGDDSKNVALLNTIFGYALPNPTFAGAGPHTLQLATGTTFAGGPASVLDPSATWSLADTSLPPGSQIIYRDPGTSDAVVAVIPRGLGQIIFMGWDWFDAPPVGAAPEGPAWVDVLDRAQRYYSAR